MTVGQMNEALSASGYAYIDKTFHHLLILLDIGFILV